MGRGKGGGQGGGMREEGETGVIRKGTKEGTKEKEVGGQGNRSIEYLEQQSLVHCRELLSHHNNPPTIKTNLIHYHNHPPIKTKH